MYYKWDHEKDHPWAGLTLSSEKDTKATTRPPLPHAPTIVGPGARVHGGPHTYSKYLKVINEAIK